MAYRFNDAMHFVADFAGKCDAFPAFRLAVPDKPVRNVDFQHLFQAKRLGAQLQVRRIAMPYSRLVFDGPYLVSGDFNRVRPSGQSQGFRPKRNTAKHLAPPFRSMFTAIHAPMRPHAPYRVLIVIPYAIAVNQRTLPGAIGEMFNGGNPDDGFDTQIRSAPYARVGSLELLVSYLTLLQPA